MVHAGQGTGACPNLHFSVSYIKLPLFQVKMETSCVLVKPVGRNYGGAELKIKFLYFAG